MPIAIECQEEGIILMLHSVTLLTIPSYYIHNINTLLTTLFSLNKYINIHIELDLVLGWQQLVLCDSCN